MGESEFECLNLFIVRPRPEALRKAGLSYEDNALPVYAIIHGGGFGFGAGTDPMWGMNPFVSLHNFKANFVAAGASIV